MDAPAPRHKHAPRLNGDGKKRYRVRKDGKIITNTDYDRSKINHSRVTNFLATQTGTKKYFVGQPRDSAFKRRWQDLYLVVNVKSTQSGGCKSTTSGQVARQCENLVGETRNRKAETRNRKSTCSLFSTRWVCGPREALKCGTIFLSSTMRM